MALPTILVNSATGSDTAASGAGPGTALTGSSGVSSASGLVVSLLTDNPDLSGVATDGSAVLFFNDTNAGSRNFAKITAVDNSIGVKEVTVSDAVRALQTKAWAIGGKRSAIATTLSLKLFDNNSTAGDAMPGWTIEMESGHTETIAATVISRRAGNLTEGPITIKGTSGAATRPVITFSNNGRGFQPIINYIHYKDFDIKNSNATKTASVAIGDNNTSLANSIYIKGIKINDASNKFWQGILYDDGWTIENCEIANVAALGISQHAIAYGNTKIVGCYIHDCGSDAIKLANDSVSAIIWQNIIYNNVGIGINYSGTPSAAFNRVISIIGNTIDSNDSDGIKIAFNNTNIGGIYIRNNIVSNNGGTGINFSHASSTATYLTALGCFVDFNNLYNNGTAYVPASYGTNDPGLDPTFTNAAAGDFSIGTNLKAKGFFDSTANIGLSSTTKTYNDIGAAQRQEAGGGITIVVD